jgi:hypothetical protein
VACTATSSHENELSAHDTACGAIQDKKNSEKGAKEDEAGNLRRPHLKVPSSPPPLRAGVP